MAHEATFFTLPMLGGYFTCLKMENIHETSEDVLGYHPPFLGSRSGEDMDQNHTPPISRFHKT